MTCNQAGFPRRLQMEIASLDDSQGLEKMGWFFSRLLEALMGDNAYFKSWRVRS